MTIREIMDKEITKYERTVECNISVDNQEEIFRDIIWGLREKTYFLETLKYIIFEFNTVNNPKHLIRYNINEEEFKDFTFYIKLHNFEDDENEAYYIIDEDKIPVTFLDRDKRESTLTIFLKDW